jgi:hypothetical protein
MEPAEKRTCGAKNREGKPCRKPPMKGKTRCRLHGGATPTGTKGNLKHGLYAAHLTEAEKDAWNDIPIGVVDDELRLCRVWLNRAFELETDIGRKPNSVEHLAGFELSEIRRSSKGNEKPTTDVISRRPDVMARVNWLLGRIAQLEKVRVELIAAARESGEDVADKARDLTETLREMRATEQRTDGDDGLQR